MSARSGEQRLAATGEPWITTTALEVRLNGFLELRRHCATRHELCVQSGVATEEMLLSDCVCLRANVICKLTAVDRLPVDLSVYVVGASLNSLLVRGRGVSAYYARRDPSSTNELAGHSIIVLRDVVDSYLFRMHTFHDTCHFPLYHWTHWVYSSMNKHTYLLTGSCC